MRTVILIQNGGSVFLPEKPISTGFLQKEKFQSNGCFAKIRAFSAIEHASSSLRNFFLENDAPIIVFLP